MFCFVLWLQYISGAVHCGMMIPLSLAINRASLNPLVCNLSTGSSLQFPVHTTITFHIQLRSKDFHFSGIFLCWNFFGFIRIKATTFSTCAHHAHSYNHHQYEFGKISKQRRSVRLAVRIIPYPPTKL